MGQLGDGSSESKTTPVQVDGMGWTRISASRYATCGVQSDQSLWCWGHTNAGQLVDPNVTEEHRPHRAPGAWTDVALGASYTCARSPEGRLRCWGDNDRGQLGNGQTTSSRLGVAVGGDETGWVQVFAGDKHTCGLRDDGTVRCWGDNAYGEVPSPSVGTVASLPTQIATDDDVTLWTRVALGGRHTCMIDHARRLWCAGSDSVGQVGRGTPDPFIPRRVPGTWVDVVAGREFTCALDTEREAYCWGKNAYSQLGDGTNITRQVPQRIAADGPWAAIVAGARQVCLRRGDERVCWGDNGRGQLGTGDTTSRLVPSTISDGHWPLTASDHMCSIEMSHWPAQLFCWGHNEQGQIGMGTNGPYQLTPYGVTIGSMWSVVAAGAHHTCGVNESGLYC